MFRSVVEVRWTLRGVGSLVPLGACLLNANFCKPQAMSDHVNPEGETRGVNRPQRFSIVKVLSGDGSCHLLSTLTV